MMSMTDGWKQRDSLLGAGWREEATEKRANDRTPTKIVARLVSERLNVSVTIIEVSPAGARLEIQPGLFLPKTFVLKAKELERDRVCEVVWRNKTQVGVRF